MTPGVSSKGSATGYSDFYKSSSRTPDTVDDQIDSTQYMTPEEKRKAALRRRLMKRTGK